MDDYSPLFVPGGLGAFATALFVWIRTHLKKGEVTVSTKSSRELRDQLQAMTDERDAAILRAEKAETRAEVAEAEADQWRDRFIDKLEGWFNGARHDTP